MKDWELYLFFVFLQLSSAFREDTDLEDIGSHQLERLVELLTAKECEDLLYTLSHQEENIFQHLEQLSPENNTLGLVLRVKRDVSSAEDSETQCRTALTDWLLKYGKKTFYDRLSLALQHIGRTDIAVEVGKNINQDITLSLKRYVEDYHKYVTSLNSESIKSKDQKGAPHRVRKGNVKDLTWRDLDLNVKRGPVPLYPKGPMSVVLPLVYGILLGFGGTLLAGVFLFLIAVRISSRGQQSHHHRVASSSRREAVMTM
ncbi:transmembrane and death domain protein 1 [Pholidichthys leucotaenia]